MKKMNFLKVLFLTVLLFSTSSCTEDSNELRLQEKNELRLQENATVNESNVIPLLRQAIVNLKTKQSQSKSASKPISLEDEYKRNLEYINSMTGLDVKYNRDEFYATLSLVKGNLKTKYTFDREKYEEALQKVHEIGNYDIVLESKNILQKVYAVDKRKRSISWGCGLAIAGNFTATLGLTACATGVGCPLAIAAKAIAMASLAEACLK